MNLRQLPTKRAVEVARNGDALVESDPSDYTRTIVRAARYLVHIGLPGFCYYSQWSSGTTLWRLTDEFGDLNSYSVTHEEAREF